MTGRTLQYVLLTTLLFVLLIPLSARGPQTGAGDAAASSSGTAHLMILTPQLESVRRKFSAAFAKWYLVTYHQPVQVEFTNYGGAGEMVRFFQSSQRAFLQTGTYNIDIVWGGSDTLFNERLKRLGFLQKVELDHAVQAAAYPAPEIRGVPLYDLDSKNGPMWFGTVLSSFGILYNKDLLKHLGLPAPRAWSDLADPRYRGWIVLGDPRLSSSARSALATIVEYEMDKAEREQPRDRDAADAEGWKRGMGLIRQIAANASGFAAGANLIPGIVSSGDAAAALSIDFYARAQVAAVGGGRLGYIEPEGATIVNPEPMGIVTGAQHPVVARRFIEFMLSEAAQRLWIMPAAAEDEARGVSLHRLPIMRSVYDSSGNVDVANPYLVAGGFNTRAARTAKFGVMEELVASSCIDLLPELRATREAIGASPRAVELDRQLGTFSVAEKGALQGAAAHRAMMEGDPGPWLRLQGEWLEHFRNEYRELRTLAARR